MLQLLLHSVGRKRGIIEIGTESPPLSTLHPRCWVSLRGNWSRALDLGIRGAVVRWQVAANGIAKRPYIGLVWFGLKRNAPRRYTKITRRRFVHPLPVCIEFIRLFICESRLNLISPIHGTVVSGHTRDSLNGAGGRIIAGREKTGLF